MVKILCPFCDSETRQIEEWGQSVCLSCFRRWETTYTQKLRDEHKGEFYGKKTRNQETET